MPTPEPRTRMVLGLGDHDCEVAEGDYLDAEFAEPYRYELRRGRLVVMSPNSEEHDDAADPWRDGLYFHRRTHRGIIQKIVPEAWLRISGLNYRIGDLGVYLVGERSSRKRPIRAPELMLEFLSPSRETQDRDLVERRAEYHSVGVLEYLIVDRRGQVVHVLAHRPDAYAERLLGVSDTYTSPLLPGFSVRLGEVFA